MSDLDRMMLQDFQPMAGTPFWGGAGAGGVGRLLTRLLKIFKQGKAAPKAAAGIEKVTEQKPLQGWDRLIPSQETLDKSMYTFPLWAPALSYGMAKPLRYAATGAWTDEEYEAHLDKVIEESRAKDRAWWDEQHRREAGQPEEALARIKRGGGDRQKDFVNEYGPTRSTFEGPRTQEEMKFLRRTAFPPTEAQRAVEDLLPLIIPGFGMRQR